MIGRDHEIAGVLELLERPHVRLVTLTGPGGVGKTSLGVRVADEAGDMFADGVCFVPLGAVDDPGLVVGEIVRRLGLAEASETSPLERLRAYVADRELLLGLDNFEHVLEAALLLPEILAAGPGVKLLVTSRAALHLSVEHAFPVPPLSVQATGGDGQPLDGLACGPAVELFARRAKAVDPSFALTVDLAPVVADICVHLDGLPLAIELAAARVRLLPPVAMRSRLGERFEVLTGGPRDAPSRQRTLRDAIRWSYELLEPREQRVFRLLSVFSGGFGFEAAASMLERAVTPEPDVLESCATLLDHSMLVNLESLGAEARLRMLETIREYARDQLERSGDAEQARQAHAEYFVALSARAEDPLHGPEQHAWLDRLELELPNVRLALRWLLDAGRAPEALACAYSLKRFWYVRGHLAEGVRWLEEAIAEVAERSPLLCRGLGAAAWLSYNAGELDRAEEFAGRGLAVAQELRDDRGTAYALTVLGLVARSHGRFAEARTSHDKAAAIFRSLGDRHGLTDALAHAATAALVEGDYRMLHQLADESLALCRELGDVEGMAHTLATLAFCLHAEGDDERAAGMASDVLAATKAIGNRRLSARALNVLGLIAMRAGDLGAARARFEEACAISREFGERWRLAAHMFPALAFLHIADGRPELGAWLLGCAEATREDLRLALMAYHARDLPDAVEAIRRELSAERFATAWGQGRRMTPEEALDRSLETPAAASADTSRAAVGELTSREAEVLRLLARGMSDAKIAEDLVVSRRTVHAHLRAIYRKLDVSSRSAATRWALEHGLG